jgi:TRAP-type C4-dicarboxylate transport system substrate-binding protein
MPKTQRHPLEETNMRRAYALLGAVAVAAACLVTMARPVTAQQQKFTWKYIAVIASTHRTHQKFTLPMLARIKERTNGNVDIRFVYIAETPFKMPDALPLIRDRQADIITWTPSYLTATHPVVGITSVPFIPPKLTSATEAIEITKRMWNSPAVNDPISKIVGEYKSKPLGQVYIQPMNFFFRKDVKSIKDIKGLKIRVFTPELAELVTALGGVPVNMAAPEVYEALQRGVVDGVVTGILNMRGVKWVEVVKSAFIMNIIVINEWILINEQALASLPPQYREIVESEWRDTLDAINRDAGEVADSERRSLEKEGFKFFDISDAEYQEIRKLAQEKVWTKWKARSGPGASAILDAAVADLEKQK